MGARRSVVLFLLASALVFASGLGVAIGQGDLANAELSATFIELRTYRVVTAFLVGASLSVGGVLAQGMFQNPLASPDVLGATAGASFGGTLSMLLFDLVVTGTSVARMVAPEIVLPVGCMLGALVALMILLALSRGWRDRIAFLLGGFLLSALFFNASAFVTALAQENWELGRAVVRFTLGDISGSGPVQVGLILPLAAGGIVAARLWARPLDLLLSGELEAESLGVDTAEVRLYCVAWTALLSGGAVAVAGNVGFVGLVVPHALRAVLGVSHRALIVASAIAGGTFVIFCDVFARLFPSVGELPLGVVTGLIGAPVFLWLLVRDARA